MTLLSETDPFAPIFTATNAHRSRHGCETYPYDKGTLLGVLAAAVNPRRIVEVGTALGYTAAWLAYGARLARIDTIESDPEHVRIARRHLMDYKVADRVQVHHGDAITILEKLDINAYELAFFDGFVPMPQLINGLRRRLRKGGVLVCANLTLGGDAANRLLADAKNWMTHSMVETAIAVKL